MLSQKDIQAQLKANKEVLRDLLGALNHFRECAAYNYELSEDTAHLHNKKYYLDRHLMYLDDYQYTKNKFLTLSAVQAKLKRMLANVARQEALKLDDIPF